MAEVPARAGFDDWVSARRPALLRTAYLLTGDPHDAEDLVQTALIKVVPRWHRIAEDPEPYVRTVLSRESVSRWRRRRWREVHTDRVPDDLASAQHDRDVTDREVLRQALGELSPRQRTIVVLRYFDGLTEAETAHVLGLGLGTVKKHGREAMARLRDQLGGLVEERGTEETGRPVADVSSR
ncbi:SigE family RNA polymerase sigma factor [Nocardioides sp. GY 10127]|uniref:SigE family RNA polymerase sigma factor n=1 Tax=Nocardioides sp. GY 10127 TaxID=2569762 RepID=UPI0010A8D15B|nr:SigE family RNA polymerase sigma factor [Nocardioides sp. GY 10127]TIC86619.1 SigE family RNA polymerase sigma factor [Nocardioides sp. GY 10127]